MDRKKTKVRSSERQPATAPGVNRLKRLVNPRTTLLRVRLSALSIWMRREAAIIRRAQLDRQFLSIDHGFDYGKRPLGKNELREEEADGTDDQ